MVEVNHGMSEEEKTRTVKYLKDQKKDRRMKLSTPKEASELLKGSIHTLTKWTSQGQGPDYVKTGKSVKYGRDTVGNCIFEKAIKTEKRE
jgi:hypothetical protein